MNTNWIEFEESEKQQQQHTTTRIKKIRKNPSRKRIDFFVPRHFHSVGLCRTDGRLVGFVLFGVLSVRRFLSPNSRIPF